MSEYTGNLDKIDTVLFDFDGTLVKISIDFAEMKRMVLLLGEEYGVSPGQDLYVLESVEDIFISLMRRDEAIADAFKCQAEEIIVNIEMEAAENSIMFPGADNVLKELKNRGIKTAIVTRNCKKAVVRASEMAGFIYDLLLTRDDVQKVKPDPVHLLDALNLLNSNPKRAIMVGDQPMDIIAGKKAGMKTAAVLTVRPKDDFMDISPDIIFDDVSGILDVI